MNINTEIKRYSMESVYNKYACADEVKTVVSSDGEWVLYQDHAAEGAALRAEIARLQAALADRGEKQGSSLHEGLQVELPPLPEAVAFGPLSGLYSADSMRAYGLECLRMVNNAEYFEESWAKSTGSSNLDLPHKGIARHWFELGRVIAQRVGSDASLMCGEPVAYRIPASGGGFNYIDNIDNEELRFKPLWQALFEVPIEVSKLTKDIRILVSNAILHPRESKHWLLEIDKLCSPISSAATTPPTAERKHDSANPAAVTDADKRDAVDAKKWREWSAMCNRVDSELPNGWLITYDMGPEMWGISLSDPDGNNIEFYTCDCESDAEMVICALDAAIAASEQEGK